MKLLIDALHFIHSCLQIDFYSMPVNTLRRFKKHYKLPSRPGLTKAQLADVSAAACCCCMHFIFLVMLQLFFFCDVTSSQHDYTMHKYQCILYVDVYSFRLLQLVSKHFRQIHVIEKEVLTYFIYMAKSCRSRFDKGCDGSVP